MKTSLLILIVCLFSLSACTQNWSERERKEFMSDCLDSRGTEGVCVCILNCLESEYDNYVSALITIEKTKIKEKVDKCLQLCE